MSFPRYNNYRDSGVEWLGDVPNHWACVPLRAVAVECDSPNVGMIESNLLSLSYGRIVRKNIDDNDGLLPESFETYQIVEADDVVWRLTDLQNDKRSLRTALVGERGIITSAYLATRPTGIEPPFLSHLLRAYDQLKVFYSMGGGLRQSMKFADVRYLPILLPTRPEQVSIAAFLDRETAKIDALVEEQRRLIELLKEKRQAVVSDAVTKGLDPSVPMKDSGVEWLGEVPAHWDVVQLGRLCRDVADGPHFSPAYEDEGVLFLSARNVKVDGWSFDDAKFISEDNYAEFCKRVTPERGDVLYTKGGTTGIARAVDFDIRFQVWVHIAVLKLEPERADPFWLAYALNSSGSYEQSQLFTRGATNQDLGLTRMIRIRLAAPPENEQRAIAAFLDESTAKLDSLIREAEMATVLLQERRAALISAAVTGKIDVRRTNTAQSAVDPKHVRDAVGAEIIRLIWRQPTFGRVKFQKLTYLAETHVGIPEIGGRYDREAAGPYDRALMQELEANLKTSGLADIQQPGGARAEVSYRFTGNEKAVAETAKQVLGSRLASLHDLIKQLGDMQTDSVEAVATLYAVWNDMLLDGQAPDEQALINGVLQDWHPEKGKKFKPADLTRWLDWMRRHEFTPKGQGPRTTRTHLLI